MESELYEQWLMTYRKSAHSMYDLKVHLVWMTNYRYPVLSSEMGKRTREILRQVCNQLNVQILSGHVSKNHIHLLLSVPPNLAVSDLAQKLKGNSSRKLLRVQ